jgi:hypothetical protein
VGSCFHRPAKGSGFNRLSINRLCDCQTESTRKTKVFFGATNTASVGYAESKCLRYAGVLSIVLVWGRTAGEHEVLTRRKTPTITQQFR